MCFLVLCEEGQDEGDDVFGFVVDYFRHFPPLAIVVSNREDSRNH